MDNEYIIKSIYDKILSFLIENKLEDKERILGYTDREIEDYETIFDFKFPYEYKLFLKYFAKNGMRFFCGQTFKLEKVSDALEVANELLADRNEKLRNKCFVFSQWQGYNFYYLDLNENEPKVYLYMEGTGTTDKWTFKEWIKWLIRADLKSRGMIEKKDFSKVEKELDEI